MINNKKIKIKKIVNKKKDEKEIYELPSVYIKKSLKLLSGQLPNNKITVILPYNVQFEPDDIQKVILEKQNDQQKAKYEEDINEIKQFIIEQQEQQENQKQ